jgi:hypothetical protein
MTPAFSKQEIDQTEIHDRRVNGSLLRTMHRRASTRNEKREFDPREIHDRRESEAVNEDHEKAED